MENNRIKSLFVNAIGWIFDHCEGYEAYIFALNKIGYTRDEVIDELSYGCALSDDEMQELMKWYDNEFMGGDE